MLNKIKLSHFRQHVDREFVFGAGLNAIKGENEGGKTTILEALFYVLFGVRAMREGLEDIVTYHHPASKLRVDVELEHLGVTYTGYRGKSGAEVSFGKEKVTGQSEVTRFFEQLLGVDAKLAGKLMFASQKALAESLAAGPTEAGKMIEELANFDVMDDVIAAIQATRPNGVTTAVEGRLAMLRGQLEGLQADDGETEANLKKFIQIEEKREQETAAALRALVDRAAALDVAAARAVVAQAQSLDAAITAGEAELKELDILLTQALPTAPTGEELTAARAAVEAEKTIDHARRVRTTLDKTDTSMLWDEPYAALEAEIARIAAESEPLRTRQKGIDTSLGQLALRISQQESETRVSVTKLEGQLIRELTCALCQKDLKDVPEVVRINTAIDKEIAAARAAGTAAVEVLRVSVAELEGERRQVASKLAELDDMSRQLADVVKVNQRIELVYAQAGDLVTIDRSVVPGQWSWAGPDTSAGERPDVAGALVLLENRQRAADRAAAVRTEQQAQRVKLSIRTAQARGEREAVFPQEAQDTIQLYTDLQAQLEPARAAHNLANRDLMTFQNNLKLCQQAAEQLARQRTQLQDQLKAAEAELAAMQKYNALIKKVRAARPVITDKLWNIVLAGVSKHFTEVRDTPSVITRGDGRFLCNGFPVSGLSGSAEDMLGLAMRITLSKTFLPGADFLQLDEPAAACSDAREVRMLGMLSTLSFGQIIMVTHSDLADSFCDHIVNV